MEEKGKFINIAVTVARILFGITFIFSGIVKAIDPLGFNYKIQDYLISFHLVQFIPLALTVAIILIVLEFLLGVFIILGIYRKASTIFALSFMAVMTTLTLYIALRNPVADCGCFGDALIISNWNTFYKNIILLFFAFLLFFNRKNIIPFFSSKTKVYAVGFVLLFALAFCFYNIYYLPIIDFRPFKIGVNIPDQMKVDITDGDVYEYRYIYEKDGVQKDFTEENFPWEDSTWTFVDHKEKLIKKGQKSNIEDFAIIAFSNDSEGKLEKTDNITDDILSRPYTLLVVSSLLENANFKSMQEVHSLANFAIKNNIDIHVVTSSDGTEVQKWNEKLGGIYLNYAALDDRTLKTIIRSNPGLVLLKEGTILAKWSQNNIPDSAELNKLISRSQSELNATPINNTKSKLLIVCAIFICPLIGLKIYDEKAHRYRNRKQIINN